MVLNYCILSPYLAQSQVSGHGLILVKALVHQLVHLWQLVWPDYGVGDVPLVPGGHVGDGPDGSVVIALCVQSACPITGH